MHRVIVHLTNQRLIFGAPYEMNVEQVQETVTKFLQAEGQGTFVLDLGEGFGWACIPTRSIEYITVVPYLPPST